MKRSSGKNALDSTEDEHNVIVIHTSKGDSSPRIERRRLRRRVKPEERDRIWEKTKGICYLCRNDIPPESSWHVEHVMAFSWDPDKNDVFGNLLPSHAECNLAKSDEDLKDLFVRRPDMTLCTEIVNNSELDPFVHKFLLKCLHYKWKIRGRKPISSVDDSVFEECFDDAARNNDPICLTPSCDRNRDFTPQNFNQIMPFSPEQWKLIEISSQKVGEGSFGEVYFAKMQGTPVAVKKAKKEVKNVDRQFFRESAALGKITHKNVVTYYGWYEDEKTKDLYIVTEWLGTSKGEKGHTLWDKNIAKTVNAVKILLDVAKGMQWCHAQSTPLIHRDLKPQNILIQMSAGNGGEDVAKIADFGCSRIEGSIDMTEKTGTAHYRAPELRNSEYDHRVDVYAYGHIVGELLQMNTRLQQQSAEREALTTLRDSCILYDPKERPSFSDIVKKLETLIESGSSNHSEPEDQGSSSTSTIHPPADSLGSSPTQLPDSFRRMKLDDTEQELKKWLKEKHDSSGLSWEDLTNKLKISYTFQYLSRWANNSDVLSDGVTKAVDECRKKDFHASVSHATTADYIVWVKSVSDRATGKYHQIRNCNGASEFYSSAKAKLDRRRTGACLDCDDRHLYVVNIHDNKAKVHLSKGCFGATISVSLDKAKYRSICDLCMNAYKNAETSLRLPSLLVDRCVEKGLFKR